MRVKFTTYVDLDNVEDVFRARTILLAAFTRIGIAVDGSRGGAEDADVNALLSGLDSALYSAEIADDGEVAR